MLTPHQALDRDVAEALQMFDVRLLSAIARGEVNAVQLARQELANRGLNGIGKWVGFEKAQRLAAGCRA
jgi:hypothetical protein